jgi:hypothetical protein
VHPAIVFIHFQTRNTIAPGQKNGTPFKMQALIVVKSCRTRKKEKREKIQNSKMNSDHVNNTHMTIHLSTARPCDIFAVGASIGDTFVAKQSAREKVSHRKKSECKGLPRDKKI